MIKWIKIKEELSPEDLDILICNGMTDQLKACPFCENDVITINRSVGFQDIWFSVSCDKCECRTSEFRRREEAIKRWNARAESENYRKLVDFVKSISDASNIAFENQWGTDVHLIQLATAILKEIGEQEEQGK